MGRRTGFQERLFYEFDLEDVVPADHLVRRVDGVLDLSWLHGEVEAFYRELSHLGTVAAADSDSDDGGNKAFLCCILSMHQIAAHGTFSFRIGNHSSCASSRCMLP